MKKTQGLYKNSSRDSSFSDKAAIKGIQREVSTLTTPKPENHKAAFAAMTNKGKDQSNPGNSE